ncbi:hypothetical protein Cfla_2835 [Cellulomonas flavigena DSM 20109]|uniref:Uncharacterized protein n=1 Tax=Cellulomonas flavigena (strain ATCC 482 / DSM 20109 / BCRC 11376 / JCM 18109 / NBRC 3775 / NCIMB 8073 / NRS 134) TaxID=446466 RepID=D5UJT2_CELFN|nr:hypothetical protein [Cellulomonas flavigena]ADG75720.1 hypothetical protein Cfla_2835 [Cellulomonas flavigena DSM 20109]
MRPRRATSVSHLVRPVALLAVLSLAGRAALLDGQRVLATGWPAPPDGVWVAAAVVGTSGAAAAAWRTAPLVRRWHGELDAARGEPTSRVVAVALGGVVACLALTVLAVSLLVAAQTPRAETRAGLLSVVVLTQWVAAVVVVLTLLAHGVVRELLLRDVLARPLTEPGLRSVRGVVVPHRSAVEVRHPVTGSPVAAWYVVGTSAPHDAPPERPSGRHRHPGAARPATAELRRVGAVARLLGRHVVVREVAPFVVVSGGVSLRVDVDEVEVLGYVDTHHVPGPERVGRHAHPSALDGAGDGRRLHVLPFGTRVDAVGMVEPDGAGWRLRGTPVHVTGVAVVLRPG